MNYDEDLNDERQRCPHGTFIGSWWGPDYLCHWCEDGISVAEMQAIQEASARRGRQARNDETEKLIAIVVDAMADNHLPYQVKVAQALVDYSWDRISVQV